MGKYQHKYRSASIRASFWNYAWNAAYFITICTQNRELFFGDISQGKMSMSAIGHIANSCWHENPNHFPFVQLDPHIIMPNHIHGIVIIENNDRQDEKQGEETQDFAPLHNNRSTASFGPQSKNLSSIVRGFKIGVTKNTRVINPKFQWQSGYYDHIIRNEKSYHKISAYIIDNPLHWIEDKIYNT